MKLFGSHTKPSQKWSLYFTDQALGGDSCSHPDQKESTPLSYRNECLFYPPLQGRFLFCASSQARKNPNFSTYV